MAQLLISVCVPQGGAFSLRAIKQHVDDCACRRHNPLYCVECREYQLPRADDMVEDRAHECARAALMVQPEADIGVGFDRGSKVFYHEKHPIITQVAAAVLIIRKQLDKPQIVVVTNNDGSDYSKKLFDLCRQQGFTPAPHHYKCVAHRAALHAQRV